MIVANASSIISFARAKKLDLLKQVVKNLIIPEAVYEEIVIKGSSKAGAAEVKSALWIEVGNIIDRSKLAGLPDKLGQGEKEAIILAEEQDTSLLIDDPQARKEAQRRRLKLISSPNILQEAKYQNLIPSVREVLDDLVRGGFRISDKVYRDILKQAEEEH